MKIILITTILLIITPASFADDKVSPYDKAHTFEIGLALGSIHSDKELNDVDSETIVKLIYGYRYDSTWSINTGVNFGNGTGICILTCTGHNYLKHKSFILNVKGSIPLSQHWSVFGKLGLNYYDIELSGLEKTKNNVNGIGALIATGLDFSFDNGLGLGLEFSLQEMNVLTSTNASFNLSYMF